MNILHLISELEIGGAEQQLATVLPHLHSRHDNVTVAFFYGDAPLRPELDRAGIRIVKLDSRSKWDPRAFVRLVRLLREAKIDVLHTHLIQADFAGSIAARIAGVPIIVSTKHSTHYFAGHSSWLRKVDQVINRRLTGLIAVSEAVKSAYSNAHSSIAVIPNGIELAKFSPATPLTKSKIVCTVGRLSERKGQAVLLRAWTEIIRRHPDARLILVGEGSLRQQLEQSADKDTVRFLGARQDVPAILQTADVFVLPSLREGFGIAAVEAMATGLPVVATAVGGLTEIIRDKEQGLLVPPDDPGALAKAVSWLFDNPEQARQLAAAGHERAKDFSAVRTAEQLRSFYESLRAKANAQTNGMTGKL